MGDYIWAGIAAFIASALTFFSGFGLGTILMTGDSNLCAPQTTPAQ